ncbi:MAG: metallophosphoesterase [Phreatobacter sp.]|uniref:metallophosphoesterase family protein n=1 Tax=Phreatobacter sp. TaxID=1966341 RepID=UPI001A54C3E7|nr:metallophosphoesterase [Phreatobacter sp.]MBL8568749.1 metallophosphoesterase [Phreatobacter sp.]
MADILDPRRGDAEDDVSSTAAHSLLAIAGTMFSEISLPKLALAWTSLVGLPAVLVGLAPLVVTGWLNTVSGKIVAMAGFGSLAVLALLVALTWFVAPPLFRLAERSFWSLNALAVQPLYALWREGLRHLADRWVGAGHARRRALLRQRAALGAGLIVCIVSLGLAALVWPATRWMGEAADLATPLRLIVPALANAFVAGSLYLAAAALFWGLADGTMAPAVDHASFVPVTGAAKRWRVAHLSDLHIVGERYGFRLESGRAGAQGNGRLDMVLQRLAAIHAADPLDLVLVTGDVTDAGRSSEWAEFRDAVARFPALGARMLILPGNHDLNIVDRANPARLELPASPARLWRRLRTLSAIAAVQGGRVRVPDGEGVLDRTLDAMLAPHREAMAAFADRGDWSAGRELNALWQEAFPMILPPESADGLGIAVLNSNADTHFSFTNALGMMPLDQAHRLAEAVRRYPQARWIIALHHHVVEYPAPAKAFSERIGTALINGSWFVRELQRLGRRCVVMHGHRHVDWIGSCGEVAIVSAPSPVMAPEDQDTWFHIHTLAAEPGGGLSLATPHRVVVPAPLPVDRIGASQDSPASPAVR